MTHRLCECQLCVCVCICVKICWFLIIIFGCKMHIDFWHFISVVHLCVCLIFLGWSRISFSTAFNRLNPLAVCWVKVFEINTSMHLWFVWLICFAPFFFSHVSLNLLISIPVSLHQRCFGVIRFTRPKKKEQAAYINQFVRLCRRPKMCVYLTWVGTHHYAFNEENNATTTTTAPTKNWNWNRVSWLLLLLLLLITSR